MKLHELKAAPGSRQKKKRVGRGNASKKGTYCGRGMNGQNSRSGGGVRVGFEGGQTELIRRTPKLKGFKNPCKKEYFPINLALIEEKFNEGEKVSTETLIEKKIIKKNTLPIKILSKGELTKKIDFDGLAFSEAAKEKIKKAGGKIENEIITKKLYPKSAPKEVKKKLKAEAKKK